jgi:hypothetical protein
MGFFTSSAAASFITVSNGQRLYCRNPWSRPYIIPDADTERRIHKKLVWQSRVLVLGLPILYALIFHQTKPVYFVAIIFVILVVVWVVNRVLFSADLKHLNRASTKLSWKTYYSNRAEKLGYSVLIVHFICSLGFIAGSAWAIARGQAIFEAILCILFFGLAALVLGYMLLLMRQ